MSARFVVGVGVQKSASTSLAFYLKANGVALPNKKELHAFKGRSSPLSKDDYLAKFPHIPADGWFGEFTPNYCSHADALLNLKQMFPDAKVIFSYRNPITRLQSAYRHATSMRSIPRSIAINDAIEFALGGHQNVWVDSLARYGQYDVMLTMIESIFDPANVYVARYEDLGTEAEPALLAGLLRLLDLPYDPSIKLGQLNTGEYQQRRNLHRADVAISAENLARLEELYRPVDSFMRERGYRTEWF